jgi:pSer/pThr/pTyr-binding forkhead associated (FHA) protein
MKQRKPTMVERVAALDQSQQKPPADSKLPLQSREAMDAASSSSPGHGDDPRVAASSGLASAGQQFDCSPYHPTRRPPTALLVVLDDGAQKQGETIRVRKDRTVLGRETGEIVIPNDTLMSSEHAAIVREFDQGQYRWFLNDLGSKNGTFVRIARFVLKHDQQLIVGSRRYRYRQEQHAGPITEPAAQPSQPTRPKATMEWQAVSSAELQSTFPALVEIEPNGEDGERLLFAGDEMKLGSDASQCSLVVKDDPFVSPQHATIKKSQGGRWLIEDLNSTNGLWLLVGRVQLIGRCEFQLGEQRFLFQIV